MKNLEMARLSRREFLGGLAAAGAAAWAGGLGLADETKTRIKSGTDLVALGRSGIKTSVLGIGTGTISGNEQRGLGQEKFTRLVHEAFDRGIRYIDTADSYRIHTMVREALKGLPRDKFFIQTKSGAKTPDKVRADMDRFRRELGIDYFDTILMHAMMKESWPTDMRPVQDVLLRAKEKGLVRAIGISCHGWEPLAASVEAEGIDVQLVRINPFDIMMDGEHTQVAGLLKKMHAKGRGIIGMKIYGENGLGNAERRFQSLKYVLGLGCVDAFTIGFKNIQQIDETLELIRKALV
jgi:predicted aldo/keto reductase-like oxidoreductase